MLDTASQLFYHQGYNATGINQILEESSVAKASLYTHYGSKDELGVAYLKAAREEWFSGLTGFTGKKSAAIDKLLACFDFLEQNLKQHHFRGCKFINMMAEITDASKAMQQQILEHKTRLRKFIGKLAAEARPAAAKLPPDVLADTVYLLFEGAIVESKICKDTWPVKVAKRTIRNLLAKE